VQKNWKRIKIFFIDSIFNFVMSLSELIHDAYQFVLSFITNSNITTSFNTLLGALGLFFYGFLFAVIFCETGLVIFPFLPGDSLIFISCAFSAQPGSNLSFISLIVTFAFGAVLGDTANYMIGHFLGPKVFTQKSKFFKQKYLEDAQAFYEKHGNITIFIARFIPIIRTYAPFVAGIGKMKYSRFISYNVVGGIAWVCLFAVSGYFFGNIAWVQANLTYVVYAIIFVSFLPVIIKVAKNVINKLNANVTQSKQPTTESKEITKFQETSVEVNDEKQASNEELPIEEEPTENPDA
jgi:membrane-associated protein